MKRIFILAAVETTKQACWAASEAEVMVGQNWTSNCIARGENEGAYMPHELLPPGGFLN